MATQEGSTSKVLEGTKIRAAAGRLHSEYPTVILIMGVPQNGWFIRENPSINGILGYPYFRKPTS